MSAADDSNLDDDEKARLKASGNNYSNNRATGQPNTVYSSYGSTDDNYHLFTPNTNNSKAPNQGLIDQEAPPPSFTRRMSSQFLGTLERQPSVGGLANYQQYVPDAIANHIPGLQRVQSQQLTATYFCNICFTKYPIKEGFTLHGCQHQFCPPCLQGFITNKINDGVVNLKCFFPLEGTEACGEPISEQDIHAIVTAETWDKFGRFKANLENTLARQCPFCDATTIGSSDNPLITCSNNECGKQYCLYHSNAHPVDESCESYELRTAKENKMNEMAISEMGDNVRPCPQCNFRILKNGGCNHMKCVKCGCSFCWLCMEIIEDTELPNHYKDENSPCKGKQFEGMDTEPPPKWIVALLVICTIIFCLPATALGIVLGIVCYPCVLCCGGCKNERGENQNIFETMFGCWFIWIVIFVVIAVLIPVIIVYIIWEVITATYEIFRICLPCLPACPRRQPQPAPHMNPFLAEQPQQAASNNSNVAPNDVVLSVDQ